jgi:hypothetical protein
MSQLEGIFSYNGETDWTSALEEEIKMCRDSALSERTGPQAGNRRYQGEKFCGSG